MRLFIAEKPSLARAIAEVLPQPHERHGSYIACGSSDVVAWCAGHILELAEPEAYAPEYKTWTVEHLPIVPPAWKLTPSAPELLKTIKSLLPKASTVVHAGDPDREGQLLVDEVLDFLGHRGRVERLLISDLNPDAVRKALQRLEPNSKYRPLYEAALARQRADWLFGINMTRLYTVLGRRGGHDGVLSVGRVQSPVLGLVVRRDLEIENFCPKPYVVINANISSDRGSFAATWKPGDSSRDALDEDGRLVRSDHARGVIAKTDGQTGTVRRCSREAKTQAPPLPYSLPDLQVDAGRRLGLSPKQVLDACQSLYEQHRLLTYPRSDCAFLPESHFAQARQIVSVIARNHPDVAELTAGADITRKSRAWDDRKISAHHAIIPTPTLGAVAALTDIERAVYDLVARRYLAQFFPAHEWFETKIEVLVAGEVFAATGRQPLADGWRVTLPATRDPGPSRGGDDGVNDRAVLPLLAEGERIVAAGVRLTEKKTTPPERFTDDTLLQAMTGIARFVSDPKAKRVLKENDGIGTPATQASIIQLLHDRRFLAKEGPAIVSTPIGRALIQLLPPVATQPDLTALWEAAMRRIAGGQLELDAFLQRVVSQLHELVGRGRTTGPFRMPGSEPRACSRSDCGRGLFRSEGGQGTHGSCSRSFGCSVKSADPSPSVRRHRALSPRKRAWR